MNAVMNLLNPHRRLLKQPVNKYDKSTVVSIFPKVVHSKNPTIQPGQFELAPGSMEKPTILVVGPSSWWRDIDEFQPLMEIPVFSINIAESIVNDYCGSVLGFQNDRSSPGLFYLDGTIDEKTLKEKHKDLLDLAAKRQTEWYGVLLKMADSLWARSNGNPLAVNDDMRMAARETGQVDRDWMRDFKQINSVKCAACGTPRNPEFPVCASCKYIDPTHPKAKELKFAQ